MIVFSDSVNLEVLKESLSCSRNTLFVRKTKYYD